MQPTNSQQPFFQGQPPLSPLQPIAASQQKRQHSRGLVIPLTMSIVFFVGALIFGLWAFSERQSYKNQSDKKAAQAVAKAEDELIKKKDVEFAEREKEPFKTYTSPSAAGTIKIKYPKTWSAFITESDRSSTPVNGYFHPNFVPGLESGTSFALRIQVVNQSYSQTMRQYESQTKGGKVKVSPFRAPGVKSILGARIDGQLDNATTQGSMVVLPLRDKTIKLWTESESFLGDFNKTVLASFTFSP